MTITRSNPGTIYLGGPMTEVNDIAASEAISPGHLVLRFNNAGVVRYKKHDGAGVNAVRAVAREHSMGNKSIADAYAANDLVEVGEGGPGSSWLMIIASGQNIAAGALLESAGNGTLRVLGSGVALFSALENKNNAAGPGDAYIRVEAV